MAFVYSRGMRRLPIQRLYSKLTLLVARSSSSVSKKLVIVESATKAKTIQKFLNDKEGWQVDYCQGHLRTIVSRKENLPKKYQNIDMPIMGILLDDFTPIMTNDPLKQKIITRLKEKLHESSELYLATDADREGEAISLHLQDLLNPKVPTKRAVFHEITEDAVYKALKNTREIDTNLTDAQEARRVLDRIAGFSLSPLLWNAIKYGLSAGRVQSASLALIVRKEEARMAFKGNSFYNIEVELSDSLSQSRTSTFIARVLQFNAKQIANTNSFNPSTGKVKNEEKFLHIESQEHADKIKGMLEDSETKWQIINCKRTQSTKQSPVPFITSSLQMEANQKLGFSSKETMSLAQSLYEKGFITYMRTDSTTLSFEAETILKEKATLMYGQSNIKSSQSKNAKKKKNVLHSQDAHEAIRPAIKDGEIQIPKDTELEQGSKLLKLYTLIFNKSIASVMENAKLENLSIDIRADLKNYKKEALVRANKQYVIFAGYQQALGSFQEKPESTEDDDPLSKLEDGQSLNFFGVSSKKNDLSPPSRFTEGSLIKEMEAVGIGRPSTYTRIIETLKDRSYICIQGKTLYPTLLGFAVTQFLSTYCEQITDVKFTSNMETSLDLIAKGEIKKYAYLKDRYYGENGFQNFIELKKKKDGINNKETKLIKLPSLQDSKYELLVGPYGCYVKDKINNEKTLNLPLSYTNDITTISEENLEKLFNDKFQGDYIGKHPLLKYSITYHNDEKASYLKMNNQKYPLMSNLNLDDLDLKTALLWLEFPKFLGKTQIEGEEEEEAIYIHVGAHPHLKSGKLCVFLPKELIDCPESFINFDYSDAIEIMERKDIGRSKDLGEWKGKKMFLNTYGPFSRPQLVWNGKRKKIDKLGLDDERIAALDLNSAKSLLGVDNGTKKKEKSIAKKEEKKERNLKEKKIVNTKSKDEKKKKVLNNKPKVPNRYHVFCAQERERVPDGLSFGEKSKYLSAKWRELTDKQKDEYRSDINTNK